MRIPPPPAAHTDLTAPVSAARGARVPAVERAISLLDRLAQQREPMTMARLAADLALPKSSVHGLCNTLHHHGYLRRQDDGAYRLGPRVMALAEAFVGSTGVLPEFNALWPDAEAAPDETVILSVLHGREVVYLAARQGSRPLGLAFKVGMRLPAWLAATGKAMLAFQRPDALRAAMGGGPWPPMASALPVTLDHLEAELQEVRQRGYSVDDEGVREGVLCFGAPVFDATGQVVAGLGVCVHKAHADKGADGRHRDAVVLAARTLTERLGGAWPPGPPPHSAPACASFAR